MSHSILMQKKQDFYSYCHVLAKTKKKAAPKLFQTCQVCHNPPSDECLRAVRGLAQLFGELSQKIQISGKSYKSHQGFHHV